MAAISLVDRLLEQFRSLDSNVLPAHVRAGLAGMLSSDVRRRHEAVNRRDAAAYAQVHSREDWEAFLAPRLAALAASLGRLPKPPPAVPSWTTGALDGEGFRIENLVFESRPAVPVTANLYLPSPRRDRMPALLLVHSHHNPKTQGELQDMGMTWARHGCMVLVMDQLGHGERRQHRAGPRQDYRSRFITGIQLHLTGESLMGWMAWDIQRGIDLLLRQPGVDPEKVIVIGAVAGGGDPAAVAAALDDRVRCVVPFNFGGPQPETPYPLPDNADASFDYMGTGYWESTRNLRLSGRDGFLPWVIVASIAPRYLVHAHEFSWDRERDPVWKRLQRIFALYGVPEHLEFAHGAGLLSGRPPEATHCNNVGAVHRRMLYPVLARWFDMPEPEEYQQQLPEAALACLPHGEEAAANSERMHPPAPRRLNEAWSEIGAARAAAMRSSLDPLARDERRAHLRTEWARLLGEIEPAAEPVVDRLTAQEEQGLRVEHLRLTVEPGIVVPALWLAPAGESPARRAVVVAFAQEGKERFLKERAGEIGALVAGGAAVCLPDLRGTGETAPDGARGFQGEATALSATEWMLGQTLLGSRLRDLRSVLRYLRTRSDADPARVALWGDSFAPVNPPGFADPLLGEEAGSRVLAAQRTAAGPGPGPAQSEPLGGLLALFGALFEEEIAAVAARGTLGGYQSVLQDTYCYVPHDAVVPGALTVGDLCDVAAALAPCPLRIEGLVDGRNVRLSESEARRLLEPTTSAYREVPGALMIQVEPARGLAAWLLQHLGTQGPGG